MPATLPCPKMPKTPAMKRPRSPSRSTYCWRRNATTACAVVRRRVAAHGIASSGRWSCADKGLTGSPVAPIIRNRLQIAPSLPYGDDPMTAMDGSCERMRIGLIGAGRIGAMHARLLSSLDGVDELLITDTDTGSGGPGRSTGRRPGTPLGRGAHGRRRCHRHRGGDGRARRPGPGGHRPRASRPTARSRWRGPSRRPSRSRELVEASGVPFQLGFQRRFDAGYREARRMVESGELGTVYVGPAGRPRPRPAARVVHPGIGRPVPGLLGARLRRHPLAAGHRGRGGLRGRRRARLPGVRQVRRRGHRAWPRCAWRTARWRC